VSAPAIYIDLAVVFVECLSLRTKQRAINFRLATKPAKDRIISKGTSQYVANLLDLSVTSNVDIVLGRLINVASNGIVHFEVDYSFV